MSTKQIINTKNAPAPIGPYNQSVKVGEMLFVSGQIALDPISGELNMDDLNIETHQVMKNLGAILAAAGSSFDRVIKSSIFLSDMGSFVEINEIYGSYFSSDYPARETIEVAQLPKSVNVEISVIALCR